MSRASNVQLAANSFPAPVPQYLASIITAAATKYRVDPNLIAAMAFRESSFNANAVSSRGAQGIMQLMPRTARALGVMDSLDPQQNEPAGVARRVMLSFLTPLVLAPCFAVAAWQSGAVYAIGHTLYVLALSEI